MSVEIRRETDPDELRQIAYFANRHGRGRFPWHVVQIQYDVREGNSAVFSAFWEGERVGVVWVDYERSPKNYAWIRGTIIKPRETPDQWLDAHLELKKAAVAAVAPSEVRTGSFPVTNEGEKKAREAQIRVNQQVGIKTKVGKGQWL